MDFIGIGLFCARDGIKTALVDLRPPLLIGEIARRARPGYEEAHLALIGAVNAAGLFPRLQQTAAGARNRLFAIGRTVADWENPPELCRQMESLYRDAAHYHQGVKTILNTLACRP